MISFAATNASGARTGAAGNRYGRGRCGSALRSASRVIGANPYMITVAAETSPIRLCQLGNGRKQIRPITNAKRIETYGTPRLLIRLMLLGTYPAWPSA